MNSSARVVLPDPGAPMMMLIEFSGSPPPRISSSSRLPVARRVTGGSSSWHMLDSPDSFASRFQEPPHRIDERVLGKRLQKKGISPRFPRPTGRSQNAEDQNGDIARSGIRSEPTAER